MRRLYVLLIVCALIVAGSFIYLKNRDDRWRSMPWGGKMRLAGVTYETDSQFTTHSSIFEPLRKTLGPRWERFLEPPPLHVTSQERNRAFILWVHTHYDAPLRRGSADNTAAALLIGDKVVFESSGDGSRRGNQGLDGHVFALAPITEKRLHIRMISGEQSMDFDVANPFYSPAINP